MASEYAFDTCRTRSPPLFPLPSILQSCAEQLFLAQVTRTQLGLATWVAPPTAMQPCVRSVGSAEHATLSWILRMQQSAGAP